MNSIFGFFGGIPPVVITVFLLLISNTFMSFAWYSHLRNLAGAPLWMVVLASWGIAFIEYCFAVPANRIGFQQLSLGELKILQEIISLSVFVPFAIIYMKQPIKLDYLWAGLCMVAAAYFIFRSH